MSNARVLSRMGNAPAFISTGSSQAIANITYTLMATATESVDTNNSYDNSAGNYKFQPTVPGYYKLTGVITNGASSITYLTALIYKNGSPAATGSTPAPGNYTASMVDALVFLNGTTDFVQLYGYHGTGSSVTVASSRFEGVLARPT